MSFKVIHVLASSLVKLWQSTQVSLTHFPDVSNKDSIFFFVLRFKVEVCTFLAKNSSSGKNTKYNHRT